MPDCNISATSVWYSVCEPSHQWMRSGSVCRATSATQSARALLLVITDPWLYILGGGGGPDELPPGRDAYYITSASHCTSWVVGRAGDVRMRATSAAEVDHGGAHDQGDPATPQPGDAAGHAAPPRTGRGYRESLDPAEAHPPGRGPGRGGLYRLSRLAESHHRPAFRRREGYRIPTPEPHGRHRVPAQHPAGELRPDLLQSHHPQRYHAHPPPGAPLLSGRVLVGTACHDREPRVAAFQDRDHGELHQPGPHGQCGPSCERAR